MMLFVRVLSWVSTTVKSNLTVSEIKKIMKCILWILKNFWAKGYSPEQIEEYYRHLIVVKPLSDTEYNVMLANFREYIVIGGMPAIVSRFVTNKITVALCKCKGRFYLTMRRI